MKMKNTILSICLMIACSITSFAQVEYTSTGGGGSYSINYPANIDAMTSGLSFTFKANHTNTGAATLTVNGFINTIKKGVNVDLDPNDIVAGQVVTVVFDGTNFQMTSASGNTGGSAAAGSDGDVQFNTSGVLNGSAALSWDNSNSRLGIGTNSPSSTLQVIGSTFIDNSGGSHGYVGSPALVVDGASGEDILRLRNVGASDQFVVKGSGNVGIGTASPASLLEIEGTTSTILLDHTASVNFSAVLFSESNTIDGYVGQQGSANNWEMEMRNNSINPSSGISFSTTVTGPTVLNRMRIANDGKVGIGTITPAATLDVTGTDAIVIPVGTDGQRPTTPESGMIRFNADLVAYEGYDGSSWVSLSGGGGTSTLIEDADGDTEINLEASPDQDVIHFSLGDNAGYPGAEYFTMIGPRLEVINSGNSVFIGSGAGANDDLSNNVNVYIGNQSGNASVSAAQNVAIGNRASSLTTSGSFNVAIGADALRLNTTGSTNVAIGTQALLSNNGAANVAIGYGSMQNNSTGNSNIALGYHSLQSNSSGTGNIAIGYQSLQNTTSVTNTAIGNNAGFNNASGSDNIFLGNSADASVPGLTNATAIGANSVVSQSNSMVLGDGTVNVGIGVSSPTTQLHINGGHMKHTGTQPGGAVVAGSTDMKGAIDVAFATNGSTTVTFVSTFSAVPTVVITPVCNADPGGTARYWISNVTATGFTVNWTNSNSTPSINYMVIE